MANKIYYNLKSSPFITIVGDFKFHFSSAFHKNKFDRELEDYIELENKKFNTRYKTNYDLSYILTISFYKKCENRGFLGFYKNKEIDSFSCLAL